jgi:hypothetical protein
MIPETSERYKIKTGESSGGYGFRWWAVVAYDADGACLGADAHWLSRDLAEQAKADYERGAATHPDHPNRK